MNKTGGGKIEWMYDADGNKLQRKVTNNVLSLTGVINSGTYQADQIEASGIVMDTSSVTMIGDSIITLLPGFTVEAGSSFSAEINDIGENIYDYVGNIEYQNGKLEAIYFEEGRVFLQKLGTNSRKNKLYKAFRELGRVIRTIFLLQYLNSTEMRQKIRAATNKVESFHYFHDWITFGGFTITTGDPVEQHKRNKYIDLVANAIMLHNVVDMTQAINRLVSSGPGLISQSLHDRTYKAIRAVYAGFGRYTRTSGAIEARAGLTY